MRVGIFGGTFNPIHYGHLRSAEDVREAFSLDRVYFVPAAWPPHKNTETLVSAEHRLKMVELAVADNSRFLASPVELERQGPSYSIDTIRYFLDTLQPDFLAFIIGIDAFRAIDSWKNYETIPTLCDLVVTTRPGEETPVLEQLLPVALKDAFWYDSSHYMHCHVSGHFLTFHHITGLSIASSTIRALIRQGRSIRYLVPTVVEGYIYNHHLYRTEESPR
ncbi:MAG TPA: nicotinate-nucleotide adenylyltransferase [Methylomirabilota bacterium]|jgi:nicotinate-nucleotide adenylyltransferase|nr:nicotinate-nucleotide adenylyltransferase [Methylomirabilota bacterium]